MAGTGRRFTKVQKEELLAEILRQYATRTPIQTIAANVGITYQTVQSWIRESYANISKPVIEEERKRDLDLIEQAIILCWTRIKDEKKNARGVYPTFADLDRLLIRRSKMIGYDAPIQVDSSVTLRTPLDDSISDLLTQMDSADKQHKIESSDSV